MTDDEIEASFDDIGRRRAVAELPQQWLMNGLYTLTFSCGTHKTIRIHTQRGGPLAGKRLLSLLIGPDNSRDYQSFGELTVNGLWIWKRWKGKKVDEYAHLLWVLAKGEKVEDHELAVSRRCLRCNRVLTTPAACERGIGDECWKKEGKST